VIVAGFGGFLLEEKSAEINPITHKIKPPHTLLAFNASLTKDDGLLRSEISIGENIGSDRASEMIRQFVDYILFQLKENKELELKGLGKFSYENLKLIFSPKESLNFNVEAFSFQEILALPLESQSAIEPIRTLEADKSVSKETEKTFIVPKSKSKNKGWKVALFTAPAVLALVAGGFFGLKYIDFSKNDSNLAGTKAEVKITQSQASVAGTFSSDESAESVQKQETTTETQTAETPQIEQNVVTENKISESAQYHVIGGVFSTIENAQQYIHENGGEVLEIDGKFKVSVANFQSIEQAKNKLNKLKQKFGNDVWITKIK
jgi:hypothetical protein